MSNPDARVINISNRIVNLWHVINVNANNLLILSYRNPHKTLRIIRHISLIGNRCDISFCCSLNHRNIFVCVRFFSVIKKIDLLSLKHLMKMFHFKETCNKSTQ